MFPVRVFFYGLMFLPLSLLAQDWKQSYQDALAGYNNNQLELAYGQAVSSLKQYQSESGETNDNYASILRLLSNICFAQDKLEEGLAYNQKELQIREGKNDLVLTTALANAAQFYRQMGEYDKAIETLLKAKEILLTFYGPQEEEITNCNLELAVNYYLVDHNQQSFSLFTDAFHNLKEQTAETLGYYYYFALLNMEMGKVKDATTLLTDTQEKYKTNSLTETVDYALVLKGLGEANHRSGKYEEAELFYAQSQKQFEQLKLTDEDEYLHILNARAINLEANGFNEKAEALFELVEKHPEGKEAFATALNNRAALAQSRGNYEQAEKFYNQSISSLNRNDRSQGLILADALENLALLELDRKQEAKAIDYAEQSYQLILQLVGKTHVRTIGSFNKTGYVYFQTKKINEAKGAYQQAVSLAETFPVAHAEMIIARVGLARCYLHESNYAMADSLFRFSLSEYQTGKMTADQNFITLLMHYASSQQDQGKWAMARALMQRALREIKKVSSNQHLYYATLMEDLAMLNLRLGNVEEAKHELDSANAFFDSAQEKNTEAYGSLLLSYGRYYQALGDYPNAESFLRQGTDLLVRTGGEDSVPYAFAINSLALHYQVMGNFAEAEPLFHKSLNIRAKVGGKMNSEYATVLQNLASLYQLQENYEKAEPLLVEANEIDKQVLGVNHPQYLVSLQNLATLYQKRGALAKAAQLLENVRAITEKTLGKNHPSYAVVISNMASLYQDQKLFEQSEKLWLESVGLRKQLLGEEHPDYARSLYGLASLYFATGKLDEAAPYFAQVIEKYQQQIVQYFDVLSEKEKSAFYSRIRPVFESYQDFCIQRYTQNSTDIVLLEKLYNLQLSTKAILLNASSKIRNSIMGGNNIPLQQLFQDWQQSKEDLVRYYSMSREERERQKIDLSKAEERANDLEKQLSSESSLFSLRNRKNISWKEVMASLKPEETAIEIIRIRKRFVTDSVYYAALIVSPGQASPQLFLWPEGKQLENRWFRYYRNAIKFHIADTLSFKHIWAPLLKALPPAHTVYVSSDGVFNKINFNCIQDPANNRWGIDAYNIRLVSNTREVTESHPSMRNTSASASIFGYADFNFRPTSVEEVSAKRSASRYGFQGEDIPMLPATEKEVKLLNDVLKEKNWNIAAYTLQNATEENLKSLHNPQILHIATHGFFLNDVDMEDQLQADEENQSIKNPLFRSGILLAGAGLKQSPGKEDGILTAYEAMNLNLDNTELVSLSACETGLGEVRNGEGVYGLQRAFLVAGARTLIMSLWQVDDEATQELMTHFYMKWLEGTDKFKAFRDAQLEMKEKYKLPYYWGAFVLIGN